jgi:hypothetical protein
MPLYFLAEREDTPTRHSGLDPESGMTIVLFAHRINNVWAAISTYNTSVA